MHIPRGFWHQATRDDGYSLHATFGIVKRVGVNSPCQWEGQPLLADAVTERLRSPSDRCLVCRAP